MIRMTLERFTVPEILFHPSNVGISQMGVVEAIIYSVNQCPEGNLIMIYMAQVIMVKISWFHSKQTAVFF